MAREVQEPTIVENGPHGTRYEHPAYGKVGAARSQGGGTPLFGTDFMHHETMKLTISRADLTRDISHDYTHPKSEIVEVEMSLAQWVTLISSPNMGSGTPCTIRWIQGEGSVPGLPYRSESEDSRDEIRQKLAGLAERVKKVEQEAREKLSGVSKKKLDEALSGLYFLEQDLRSNLPWMEQIFEEKMDDTIESAKVEIHALLESAFLRAGVQALGGNAPALRLGTGEEVRDGSD